MSETVWLFALLGLAAVVTTTAMLVLWAQLRQAQRELDQRELALRQALEDKVRAEEQAKRARELEQQVAELQASNTALTVELAELKKVEALNQEKIAWVEHSRQQLRETFQAIAIEAIRGNASHFLELARDRIEHLLAQATGDWAAHRAELFQLLDPLSSALKALEVQVRDLEQRREGAYQGLQEQLRQLAQMHYQLQTTTTTLSQAMRGSHATRGRWGEYQLRHIVEMAGMTPHVDFQEQVGGEGGRQRVDMVIRLPNQVSLPVDAKTPMNAYLDALSTTDEQERNKKLKEHAQAMRRQVSELSQRRYTEQFDQTPDLVIMFVPIEACLGAAFEQDPELFEFAFSQRVLIATPTILLALLKAVAYGWQQHQFSEDARRVAQLGSDLYQTLVEFSKRLQKLGKNLNSSIQAYNEAAAALKGKLFPKAESLGALASAGAKLRLPPPVHGYAQPIAPPQDGAGE